MNETALYPELPVMLVDDELQFLQSATFALRSSGINNIRKCQDSREVLPMLEREPACVIVCDLLMPYKTGKEVLADVAVAYPDMPVIMLTAVNEVETAVACIKLGAADYLVKPVDKTRLVTSVKNAIELRETRNENQRLSRFLLSDTLKRPGAFEDIITRSRRMQSIFGYIEAVSQTSMPVLVSGETGTGKEMIARAVHGAGGRKGEFVQVNVAGLDDTLFSDTLFGHEKGAFTGADKSRTGLVAKAAGGTIFLDEIGDLSLESQVKLLRLLEERAYYPLGSDVSVMTDAKVVVATNRDLKALMTASTFRSDLFYRLQTHHIQVPPLRERKEDIPVLADHFLEAAAKELAKKEPTPPPELYTLLSTYPFPGNVRELRSLMYDAVSMHRSGVMSLDLFREKLGLMAAVDGAATGSSQEKFKSGLMRLDTIPTIREAEQLLVDEALNRSKGNQTIAAGMLGLTRSALNKRINKQAE
jgi:DNA-binding NtrC family response regulator